LYQISHVLCSVECR